MSSPTWRPSASAGAVRSSRLVTRVPLPTAVSSVFGAGLGVGGAAPPAAGGAAGTPGVPAGGVSPDSRYQSAGDAASSSQ